MEAIQKVTLNLIDKSVILGKKVRSTFAFKTHPFTTRENIVGTLQSVSENDLATIIRRNGKERKLHIKWLELT